MVRLLAALICLLLASPAHAQTSKSDLATEINTNLPDNTTGLITPAAVRTTLIDMVNSWLDLNGTGGFNCASNEWVNAFSNLSTPSCAQPTFANIMGNVAVTQLNNGTNASAATFWRGDGTWVTPAGAGTVTEQKNTAGFGLSTSGNCDNTGSNAGSPCQYQLTFVAKGSLSGLGMSNDGSTPNTVLDIATGSAADSTNAVTISIGAFTKSIAGAWAAGTAANGMGNGLTATLNTWYHVCLANNGGVADIYFDTSVTCANRPAGISDPLYRRIGSFKTDASVHILSFFQNGDYFWGVGILEFSGTTRSYTALTLNGVPPGISVIPWLQATEVSTTGGVATMKVGPNSVTALSTILLDVQGDSGLSAAARSTITTFGPPTNTSQQLFMSSTGSVASALLTTTGYIDLRGK